MRPLAAVVVVGVAGCYAPSYVGGEPCTSSDNCPTALTCHLGHCVAGSTIETAPDAAPDAFHCTPIAGGAGEIHAPKANITVDGSLDDWPTCFITLDTTTAIVSDNGAHGMYPIGKFAVAHDDTHVYVGVEVQGVLPLGDETTLTKNYFNNGVSFYIDADGVFDNQAYDADAEQIIVDHANRMQAYHTTTPVMISNIATATHDATTFTIEMSVEATTFGDAMFAPSIGFDIGLVGGDGTQQTSEVLWYKACSGSACTCSNGTTSEPYCDAREFGRATLE